MALQHTRKPSWMSDADYVSFTEDVEQFLADDRSLPDRPDHLIAQQAATGAAYRAVFTAMNAALGLRKAASETIKNTVKLLKKKLSWMKTVLPTLTDESILLPFGLDKPVKEDYDEVKAMADAADVYWQTVSGDALYAPFADGCDELADLITTYESARATQVAADGEYSQRQNEKDLAREAHHEVERDIFTIYTGTYPDPYDDYWTQTPWGKASGGEEEPTGPVHPAAVANLTVGLNPFDHILLKWEYGEEALFDVYRATVHTGDPVPDRPAEAYVAGVASPTFTDTDHPVNGSYYYWVCAVKDGVEGEFAEPVSIEHVGEGPIPA